MVDPGIQFKPVERNSLSTNRDFGKVGPDFRVESVAVHAEVARGIAETEQPRGDACGSIGSLIHFELLSATEIHGHDFFSFMPEFVADDQPRFLGMGFLNRRQRG